MARHVWIAIALVVVAFVIFVVNFIHPLGGSWDNGSVLGLLLTIALLSYVVALKRGEGLYEDDNKRIEVLKDASTAEYYMLKEEYDKECENRKEAGRITSFGLYFFNMLILFVLISGLLLFLIFKEVIPFEGNYEQINNVMQSCFVICCIWTGLGLIVRGCFLAGRGKRFMERGGELWARFFYKQHHLRRGYALILVGLIFIIFAFMSDKFPMF